MAAEPRQPVPVRESSRLLSFLTEEEARIFRSYCAERRLPEGAILFAAGDPADCLYLLQTGQLAVEKQTGFGRNSQIIALLQPYAPVGEAGLATPGGRRRTTVRALADSVLLRLDAGSFDRLSSERPELATSLLRYLLSIAGLRLDRCSARLSHIL